MISFQEQHFRCIIIFVTKFYLLYTKQPFGRNPRDHAPMRTLKSSRYDIMKRGAAIGVALLARKEEDRDDGGERGRFARQRYIPLRRPPK
jgi:hypothetical protein